MKRSNENTTGILARLVLAVMVGMSCLLGSFESDAANDASSLMFSAPLTVDSKAGTYSGVGAAKTCRIPGASTHTALAADAVCRSSTYGTRLSPAGGNLLVRSNALDTGANWIKTAGVTITANSVVGPSGNLDAERIQLGAAPQTLYQDVAAGGSLGAFDQLVTGVWMQTHAAGAACTIDLGSSTAVGGIYYGGVATVQPTWNFYWVVGTAQLSGNVRWSLSNATTFGHGTPTCTDIDVVDAYLGNDTTGPRSYDVTGAAPVTHNAETITWPWYRRIRADKGTVELVFTASFLASWDVTADANFFTVPVDGGSVWTIGYDRESSSLVLTTPGTVTYTPATWAPDTEHVLRVSYAGGQSPVIQWDDNYPDTSLFVYVVPTFTAGGVITLGGGIDGFYRSLKIWRSVRVPNTITVTSFSPLESTLTPSYPPAAAAWTYTGGASTCLDSGGQSMSDKGNGVACYYDAAGSARGVRVSPAWTNLVRGDMDGANGATPTGWSTAGANWPLVDTGTNFHSQVVKHIETADDQQETRVVYIPLTGTYTYNFYRYITGYTTNGFLATISGTIGNYLPLNGNMVWHRKNITRTFVAANVQFTAGSRNISATSPGNNTIVYYDAATAAATSYAPPFCSGVPPVTCTAESLSRNMGAELDATSYTIRLTVTTMFGAGADKGNSGINYGNARGSNAYLISNTGFNVQWNNTDKTWVFTDGTQTATSAAQSFPPDSTHEITIYGVDGFPLMLQVDGQDWVASGGNKVAQALGATTYLLTHSAGGAELGGWVQGVDIR